jgi:hypothetical protein
LSATESNSDALKCAERAEIALKRTILFGLWSRRPRVRVPSLTPKPLQIALSIERESATGSCAGAIFGFGDAIAVRAVEPNLFVAGPRDFGPRGPRRRALAQTGAGA